MKRLALLVLAVTLAACALADPVAPVARIPNAPSATWVFDTPRPSVVSAVIVGQDGPDWNIIRITWNDATIGEDWHSLYFPPTATMFSTVLNAPGYADTGMRTVDLPAPVGYTSVEVGASWWADAAHSDVFRTPYSAAVEITDGRATVTSSKGKGKR